MSELRFETKDNVLRKHFPDQKEFNELEVKRAMDFFVQPFKDRIEELENQICIPIKVTKSGYAYEDYEQGGTED